MRAALVASIALHVAVIGALFVEFGGAKKPEAPNLPPPVKVEMISPAEFSERKAGKPDANSEAPARPAEVKAPERPQAAPKTVSKQEAEQTAPTEAAPPPPRRAETPPAPPAPPAQAAAPKPEPKREEPRPAQAERKPDPAPEKPRPEPRKVAGKPAEPEAKPAQPPLSERTFDADRIASLLRGGATGTDQPGDTPRSTLNAAPSRTVTDRPSAVINRDPFAGQVAASDAQRPWRPASSLEDQARGLTQAQGAQTSITCGDVVRGRIEQNWDLPLGGLPADVRVVRLQIELNPDGTLARAPFILDRAETPGFQAVADAAIRAAVRAQPYPIPPDQFDRCRLMNLTFDPRDIYGG